MSQHEDRLLNYMKELLAANKQWSWIEPCTEEDLARAEAELGFPLPSLLRRIYLEVGDGLFGLSPLYIQDFNGICDIDLVTSYLEMLPRPRTEVHLPEAMHDQVRHFWPEKMLIIVDWGCCIYSCLDCAHPENRILRYDCNISDKSFAVEAPSFAQWLQAYLDGTLVFDWEQSEHVMFKIRSGDQPATA
jgi:hypothetical protein